MSERSCFEVIGGVDEAMRSELAREVPYFVLGGIATGALLSSESQIDIEDRVIYATEDGDMPTRRDNKTKRDIDILVGAVLEKDKAGEIKRAVSEAVNNDLEVSIFNIEHHNPEVTRSQAAKLALSEWTSRRTIDENGTLRLEIFPAQVELSKKVLEPWKFFTSNGDELSVMSPAVQLMNYATRSISGVRHKDKEKLNLASKTVLGHEEFREDLVTGELANITKFAIALDKIREGNLELGSEYLRYETSPVDLEVARYKANFLKWLESHDAIVDLALQGPVQKILNIFVRSA